MTDSILFWNAVALEANRVSHSDPAKGEQTGPTLSSRALAIVHLAMYDAYAGVENNAAAFPRYLTPPPPPPAPGASHRDAVAGAAFTTLAELFKSQRDFFESQLSCFDTSNTSYKFGVRVGEEILKKRKNDPDARDCGYAVSTARGRHRPDPDNPRQGFHAPYYGAQSKGFAVTQRHSLDRPPFEVNGNPVPEYIAALKQVRAEGIMPELMATLLPASLFNDRRTPDETLIGIYWGYDGANRLGTPPRLYNQIIRLVAMHALNPDTGKVNMEGDNARLFAFVNAAMGDAGIFAWEQKYCHDLWRPVVGIREHDKSFGPGARNPEDAANDIDDNADPFWLPLGAPSTNTMLKNFTPPFPAYPSGHATFGAAAFHITRLFYGVKKGDRKGDKLFDGLAFVSEELNGANQDNRGAVRPRHVRNFKGGLWDMIIENGVSRVYLGVHWVFDAFAVKNGKPDLVRNVGGVPLGLDIAEDIFGVNKRAPQMTPDNNKTKPPIETPDPNTKGMPTVPKQPGSEKDCANTRDKKEEGELATVKDRYPSGRSPR